MFQVNIWMVTKEAFVTVPRKKQLSDLLHMRCGDSRSGSVQEAFSCLSPQGLELSSSVRLNSLLYCSFITFAFLVKHQQYVYRHTGERSVLFLCHEHQETHPNQVPRGGGHLAQTPPFLAPASYQCPLSSHSHNWNDCCLYCGGVAARFQRCAFEGLEIGGRRMWCTGTSTALFIETTLREERLQLAICWVLSDILALHSW